MTNSEAVSLLMNSQYYKQGYNQGVSDTLDKIRADLHYNSEMHEDGNWYLMDKWVDEILDKYKAKDGEEE